MCPCKMYSKAACIWNPNSPTHESKMTRRILTWYSQSSGLGSLLPNWVPCFHILPATAQGTQQWVMGMLLFLQGLNLAKSTCPVVAKNFYPCALKNSTGASLIDLLVHSQIKTVGGLFMKYSKHFKLKFCLLQKPSPDKTPLDLRKLPFNKINTMQAEFSWT